jgi:ribosomal protein L40E
MNTQEKYQHFIKAQRYQIATLKKADNKNKNIATLCRSVHSTELRIRRDNKPHDVTK